MLLARFEHEKNNAKAILGSKNHPVQEKLSLICRPSGYDIFIKADPDVWLDTLPINDGTSFFLDVLLLQELSSILLLDLGKLKQVCLTVFCFIKADSFIVFSRFSSFSCKCFHYDICFALMIGTTRHVHPHERDFTIFIDILLKTSADVYCSSKSAMDVG